MHTKNMFAVCVAIVMSIMFCNRGSAMDSLEYYDAEYPPWYVGLHLGRIMFEGDEYTKDGTFISLRLGYNYSTRWTYEGALTVAPSLKKRTVYNYEEGVPVERPGLLASSTIMYGLGIDALFHLFGVENRRWDPFLIGGFEVRYFDEKRVGRYQTDPAVRAGMGLAYHFNPEWAVRGDFVATMTVDKTEFNLMPSIGVMWNWGAHIPRSYVATGGWPVEDDYQLLTTLYIEFETDKWDIHPQYFELLDLLAESIERIPDSLVRIEGHADRRKTSVHKHNMQLSERRANAVLEYLIGQGINRDRMQAVGYGFTRPVAKNDPITGHPENRRVEVYIKEAE